MFTSSLRSVRAGSAAAQAGAGTGLLAGRTAIITGAAGPNGLGRAMARLFAAQGAQVAILDLDKTQAADAAVDIGVGHIGLACDVTDMAACEDVVRQLDTRWGRIDILVNNAGLTQSLGVMDIEHHNFDAVIDVNLRGTLQMSQAVIPRMRTSGKGSIINLSSIAALSGGTVFSGAHYCAAKAGVLGLTKALARELAPDRVRVNAICPGFIATDFTKARLAPGMLSDILTGIPLGRAGAPDDVAGCALFLASDLSAYCTGIEISANGGALIH